MRYISAAAELTAANSVIALKVPPDCRAAVGLQWVSGAGTIVLEVSIDGVTWGVVLLTLPDGTTSSGLTAASMGQALIDGYPLARVRKSSGSAACVAAVCVNHNSRT